MNSGISTIGVLALVVAGGWLIDVLNQHDTAKFRRELATNSRRFQTPPHRALTVEKAMRPPARPAGDAALRSRPSVRPRVVSAFAIRRVPLRPAALRRIPREAVARLRAFLAACFSSSLPALAAAIRSSAGKAATAAAALIEIVPDLSAATSSGAACFWIFSIITTIAAPGVPPSRGLAASCRAADSSPCP